jgi:hypothetical protein
MDMSGPFSPAFAFSSLALPASAVSPLTLGCFGADGDDDGELFRIPRHPKYFMFLTPIDIDSIGSSLSAFFRYRDFGFPGWLRFRQLWSIFSSFRHSESRSIRCWSSNSWNRSLRVDGETNQDDQEEEDGGSDGCSCCVPLDGDGDGDGDDDGPDDEDDMIDGFSM